MNDHDDECTTCVYTDPAWSPPPARDAEPTPLERIESESAAYQAQLSALRASVRVVITVMQAQGGYGDWVIRLEEALTPTSALSARGAR